MIQVTHPLCDRNMIIARLDAVSEIGESMGSPQASQDIKNLDAEDVQILKLEFNRVLSSVLTTLGRAPDIQRGITRIFHRTATPTEVANGFYLACYCLLVNVHCSYWVIGVKHIN